MQGEHYCASSSARLDFASVASDQGRGAHNEILEADEGNNVMTIMLEPVGNHGPTWSQLKSLNRWPNAGSGPYLDRPLHHGETTSLPQR